ncbi:hypothetical protein [Gordonibacter massiliensis (ex Traore et al. 2017)]|uniref:hypothetical protein n=1 Tax=Gordonibacter massiliensis (ex Traore et al. 2017) TaxID=1841863 RepID=UPI001C8C7EF0|nr:hypothetical protein [Gordonibacter massiliensis (ex Traore et al. 2017)]MBX9035124.1 hypothetical protein [Gordonibacter massiliensis (ex Traore et al. 2017)]
MVPRYNRFVFCSVSMCVLLLLLESDSMPPLYFAIVLIAVVVSCAVLAQQFCRTVRNYVEFDSDNDVLVAYGLKTHRIDAGQITMVATEKSSISKLSHASERLLAVLASIFVYGEASLFKDAASFDHVIITTRDQAVVFSVEDEGSFLRAAASYFPNAMMRGMDVEIEGQR